MWESFVIQEGAGLLRVRKVLDLFLHLNNWNLRFYSPNREGNF